LFSSWYPLVSIRAKNMVKFTLRVDDDELVGRFDELARDHGMTRTALIVQLMQDAVHAGYAPMREGEGFRAITGSGAEVSLLRHDNYVSSGKHGLLTDDQEAAFERAQQVASPEYGSQWVEARTVLEKAGFKVFKS
jgi:hypothetical protein